MQSVVRARSEGSCRQWPAGKEMLEGPKSVRSKTRSLSPGRTCMCMAEMPRLDWSSFQLPAMDGGY